jgi:hypothetical protein
MNPQYNNMIIKINLKKKRAPLACTLWLPHTLFAERARVSSKIISRARHGGTCL